MPSVYDLKPRFQALLRPLVVWLAESNITPNQITLFTCLLSIVVAGIVAIGIHHHWVFWLLPITFFIRMALNAIDGMLAKEHEMKTALGAILNELTDMLSDAVLYLPFALIPWVNPTYIILIVVLSMLTEAAGLAAIQIGASRRYDGPFGKSDRALGFSLVAILLAMGVQLGAWLILIWIVMILLLALTLWNRIYKALKESSC